MLPPPQEEGVVRGAKDMTVLEEATLGKMCPPNQRRGQTWHQKIQKLGTHKIPKTESMHNSL